MGEEMRTRFFEILNEVVEKKKGVNNFYITDAKYNQLLKEVKEAKEALHKRSIQYRRLKRYDILMVGSEEKLIAPLESDEDQVLYFVRYGELFDVIHKSHISTGHGGRTRTLMEANRKYKNVTTESVVIYLRLCQVCLTKQQNLKKYLVKKPIQCSEMNMTPNYDSQVELIYKRITVENDVRNEQLSVSPPGNPEIQESRRIGQEAMGLHGGKSLHNKAEAMYEETEIQTDEVEDEDENEEPLAAPKPLKRAKTEDDSSNLMSSAFQLLQTASAMIAPPPDDDEVTAFFKYVITKVKTFSPETRRSIQNAVFEILMKADSGIYEKKDSTKSPSHHDSAS